MPPITRFLLNFTIATATGFLLLEAYAQISRLRCWSGGYGENSYLGLCQSLQYGDYEHSALALGLEPAAVRHFQEAQVLILGNSRAQFAFSSKTTRAFFETKQISFYNAAFSGGDGSSFAEVLFTHWSPKPSFLIINADPFFLDFYSRSASSVVSQPGSARKIAEAKKAFQDWHASICSAAPFLCGNTFAVFRSRLDGTLSPSPSANRHYPLVPATLVPAGAQSELPRAIEIGRAFLATKPLPHACIVLTTVPSELVAPQLGREIADQLGLEFVSPDIPNLETFDHSHLTPESADRFSGAFLQSIESRLDACIHQTSAL